MRFIRGGEVMGPGICDGIKRGECVDVYYTRGIMSLHACIGVIVMAEF